MNLPSSNRSPEKHNSDQEQQPEPARNSLEDLRSSSDPSLSSSGSHDITDSFPYLTKSDSNPLTSFSYPLSNTHRSKYSLTHWDPLSPQTSQIPHNFQASPLQHQSNFAPFASFHSSTASSLSISPSGLIPPNSSSLNISERVNTSISTIMPNPANPFNAGSLRMASSSSGNKQVLTQVTEVCESLLQLVNVCKDGVITETHFFRMYESVKSLNLLMSFVTPSFSTNIQTSSGTQSSNPPSNLSNLSNLQALASASMESNNNSPIQLPPVSQIANLSTWPVQKPAPSTSQYTKMDSQINNNNNSNNNSNNTGQNPGTGSPEIPSPRSGSPTEDVRFNPYKKIINRNRRIRKGKSVQIKDEERMCAWCNCTQTPEWRNGPNNSMLCNACGLQYRNLMKQEREEKEKNAIGKILNPSQAAPT